MNTLQVFIYTELLFHHNFYSFLIKIVQKFNSGLTKSKKLINGAIKLN